MRYLVNLAMAVEVEADTPEAAVEAAKETPISEQRVYHTQTQPLEDIVQEPPWTKVVP
jgi:hypothetical protein